MKKTLPADTLGENTTTMLLSLGADHSAPVPDERLNERRSQGKCPAVTSREAIPGLQLAESPCSRETTIAYREVTL